MLERKINVKPMKKSKIKVINVEYGKGKAKLISAQIKTKYGESQEIP